MNHFSPVSSPGFPRVGSGLRRGVVLYLVIGVMAVLAVVLFAMYSQMQEENARIHRVYFGTAALKIAEACETEAFTWLTAQLELPADHQHPFLRRLYSEPSATLSVESGSEPADPLSDPRYLDLLGEGLMSTSVGLAARLPGGGDIQGATLSFRDLSPLFHPPTSAIDPETQGQVLPDGFERFGAVEFTVSVGYGRVRRGSGGKVDLVKRYVSRRDLKVVNLLAPTVSRFTLFAHQFTGPGTREPYNVDRGPATPTGLWEEELAGVSALERQQPLVLVHSPMDVKERVGAVSRVAELARYLPFEAPFDKRTLASPHLSAATEYRPDLQDRGWVFLGGDEPWSLNLKNGLINPRSALTPAFSNDWAEEITTEGFMIRETFLTADQTRLAGLPQAAGWDPDLSPGVDGYRFSVWSYGVPGGILNEPTFRNDIFGNYFSRAEGAAQSVHPSLLRLYGDVQAHDLDAAGTPGRYLDRRSPTLVLGPVLRRYTRLVKVSQMDQEDRDALAGGTFPKDAAGTEVFPYREPGRSEPREAWIPYFHVVGDALDESEAAYSFDSPNWPVSGNPLANGAEIDDSTPGAGTRPVDYPAVRFRINEHVFRGSAGTPLRLLGLLESRIRTQHYNTGIDWISENAHPGGLDPVPRLGLGNLSVLQSFQGTPPSDARAFYSTQDPDSDLCYFAGNLRLHQFDETALPPGNLANGPGSPFPDGFFEGSLRALRLVDPAVASDQVLVDGGTTPGVYDLRMKTTHAFQDASEFLETFLPGGSAELLLSPGVSLVRTGDLDLSDGRPELVFHQGGMILVEGNLRLPRILKSPEARASGQVLTLVSLGGNIELAGDRIEASVVVLGAGRTVTRAVEHTTLFGNLVVDTLVFEPDTPGNLFSGRSFPVGGATAPTGDRGLQGWERNLVEYDPALNQAAAARYRKQYRAFVSGGLSYWQVGE